MLEEQERPRRRAAGRRRYAHGANDALVEPPQVAQAGGECADFGASVAGLRAFSASKRNAHRRKPRARRRRRSCSPRWAPEKDAKERDGGGGKGRQAEEQQGSRGGCETARHKAVLPAGGGGQAAAAAATDAFETRAEITALSAPAAPPVEESVQNRRHQSRRRPPRWRSAPVPAVFAPSPRARPPGDEPAPPDPPSTASARGHGDGAGSVSGRSETRRRVGWAPG